MDLAEKMERLDVVDMIEKEIGKSAHDLNDDEIGGFLKLAIQINGIRSAVEDSIPDTNMRSSFDDVINIIKKEGFQPAYKMSRSSKDRGCPETEYIFCHPCGFVIYIESFYGTSVNTFTLMGEVFVDMPAADGYNLMDRICCGGGSFGYFGDNSEGESLKASLRADCRTGFLRKLNLMRELGTPIPRWENDTQFFWFLNYDEEHDNKKTDAHQQVSLDKIRNSDGTILKRIFSRYL